MNTKSPKTTLKQLNRAERTQAAILAHDNKLNLFPIAANSKMPIGKTPVQPLDYMRLFWNETEIRELFGKFDCNIAVKLGETSLNTFVVDVDDPGRAIEVLMRLASHHIRTLTIKSPNRGYHFYFSCTDCAIATSKFTYGDLKGQGSYVLFTGSVIDGKPYTLVDAAKPHTDTLSNLQALIRDVLGESVVLQRTTYGRSIWRDLPVGSINEQRGRFVAFFNEYLDNPTPIGNRKNKLYKNTLYSLATGRKLDAVEAAAQRDGLPQSEIDRTITAAQHDSATPAIGGQSWHWHTAKRFVDTFQGWAKGQQGNTERAIMLALIERCRMDASAGGVFRASIREIKQLAQRSQTKAVNTALSRLIDKGLLIRVSGSRQRDLQDCGVPQPVNGRVAPTPPAFSATQKLKASHWKFGNTVLGHKVHSRNQRFQETDVPNVYLTPQIDFMQDERSAELLERGALGQSALRVHTYLMANNGAPSQRVIADALGINHRTVGRALHKMTEKYKLVEYSNDDRRWYAVPMADDEWKELGQQHIDARGKSRYEQRKARFGKERHDNLLTIYHSVLKHYQAGLEWHEQRDLARDPLIAEAFSLGASKVEQIA